MSTLEMESNGESVRLRLTQAEDQMQRVSLEENQLARLFNIMSEYTQKSATVRDKNDEIAVCLAQNAQHEKLNTTSKLALTVVAEKMAEVGDHRNAHVKRLEAKVLTTLSTWESTTKYLKADISKARECYLRERVRRKDMTRFQEKAADPRFYNAYLLSEGQWEKAKEDSKKYSVICQQQMRKFEEKRIIDIKQILKDFFEIEVFLHAKCLEIFSEAYRRVDCIDEVMDFEIFKSAMAPENKPVRRNTHKDEEEGYTQKKKKQHRKLLRTTSHNNVEESPRRQEHRRSNITNVTSDHKQRTNKKNEKIQKSLDNRRYTAPKLVKRESHVDCHSDESISKYSEELNSEEGQYGVIDYDSNGNEKPSNRKRVTFLGDDYKDKSHIHKTHSVLKKR